MGKTALNGPWCDFSEVIAKTGLAKNEILYFIESGDIEVTLHTNNRPFLAITCEQNKRIGNAVLRYSGPISVDTSKTLELVRDGRTILGRSIVHFLQPINISKWTSINPFKCPLPNNLIEVWQPINKALTHTAILMPEEGSMDWVSSCFADLIPESFDEEAFFELYADEYLVQSPLDRFAYNTSAASVYYQNDLRFPAKAVNILKRLAGGHEVREPVKSYSIKKNKRCNELHQVIRRALADNPLSTSKALWEIIREDFESGILRYDRDELIHHIDNMSIEWTNSNNVHQQLKWSSFQVLLSKLKAEPQELAG